MKRCERRNDKMENYTEKNSSSTEKSNGNYATGQGNPLYDMFVTQLSRLHTVCSKEALARGFGQANLVRSIGETWFVDPRYGRGSYWFYLMDGDTIVVSMDITYERAVEASIETVPYLGFGLYEHAMPMYCSPECAGSNCKLIGHDWNGGPYISSFESGKRLSSASITIATEAIRRYADALHCDEKKLRRAIGQLTTSDGVPGLPSALRGLDITYPAASVADSYYHAKVIECFALLASSIPERVTAADAVHISDRDCVECICSYIDSNLSSDLSTKTLCDIAHVSEGKMISAFRNVQGDTPQSYIRAQRLEYGRRLLLDGSRKIGEIAKSAGYRNQGAFTDAFKRAYGTTPRAYRKRLRIE